MNIPPPMQSYVYKSINSILYDPYTSVASDSMQKASVEKKFSGTGRCTNKVMNTLQNYYGMMIRSNVGNLYGMKKG